jgi:Arc/MetJ family transcription regulator
MRTTLDLPEELLHEAMKITHMRTKTNVIIHALQDLVQKNTIQKIKEYRGKLKLDIDLNSLRKR